MNKFYGNKTFKCIILSAGLSGRMKSHKALLHYSDGETFLQHIINVYQDSGVSNITVVANPEVGSTISAGNLNGVAVVKNNFPEWGRLFSLQLGLKQEPGVDFCFIQNIDNPFVTKEIIDKLIATATKADYVTPAFEGQGGHPVLISAKIIRHILSIEKFNVTLHDELKNFSRYKVEVGDEKILTNINTQDDYKKYFNRNPIDN